MERPDVVTIAEAAQILECTERSIRNMVKRGELTKIMIGKKGFYLREQVISLRHTIELRSTRLDEVAQLHKVVMSLNEYIVRLDARISLLENIIETRSEEASLGPAEIRVFKEMAIQMLGDLEISYTDIQCWASDINRLSFESAESVGIQLLYMLTSHLMHVLTNNTEFLGGWDLHHVRDILTMAKFKILGFAQLAGINNLEDPPMIMGVMNQLSKRFS